MKLKAQSSKLKISSNSEAPNEIAVHGPGILALDFILSFELWIWSFYPCLGFGAICDYNDHLASLIALAERYSDRKPDFAADAVGYPLAPLRG